MCNQLLANYTRSIAARPKAPAPAKGAAVRMAKPEELEAEAVPEAELEPAAPAPDDFAPLDAAEAALLEALARAPLMEDEAAERALEAELAALEITEEADAVTELAPLPVAVAVAVAVVVVVPPAPPVAAATAPPAVTPAEEQ